jgi:predicted protein tyrosine phosphatase
MFEKLRALLRPRTKILFVCSQNRLRSRTAETVFEGRAGLSVRSAGTLPAARVRVDEALVAWADAIFGMEAEHVTYIQEHFPSAAAGKVLVALEIPDDYDYLAPALVELLEAKMAPYLPGASEGEAPPGAG